MWNVHWNETVFDDASHFRNIPMHLTNLVRSQDVVKQRQNGDGYSYGGAIDKAK